MQTSKEFLSIWIELGGVHRNGHFVYKGGRHGSEYADIDPLLPHPELMHNLCVLMTSSFWGRFDTLAVPAVGAIPLASVTSEILLRRGIKAGAIWADKAGSGFVIERAGFAQQLTDRRVLVLEGTVNTGGSAAKVCQLVSKHGGQLIGVSAVCNLASATKSTFEAPFFNSICQLDAATYTASQCQLCADGVPIVANIGHGREFKKSNPDYPGGYIEV